jgi:hypothetical protein
MFVDPKRKGVISFMKALSAIEESVTLSMKGSGAEVLQDLFVFSKTIGKTVASKKGLTGDAATTYAAKAQRCLRRVRKALENR